VAHYQALRWQVPGGGEGLCWTVVRGLGEPVTVEQVVRRIGGDPATLDCRDLLALANIGAVCHGRHPPWISPCGARRIYASAAPGGIGSCASVAMSGTAGFPPP
jgi:hypothetical protein